MNVVFILSDDHRYDFMGFTGKVPFLKTPNMDRMAREGTHIQNAFVTTSLCSPSRASILTGQFSHRHQVIDNQSAIADSSTFFPQYLENAGYETAFFGKWHMGEHHARPRKGFTHWESFKGQGVYYNPTLNINGEEKSFGDSTYITDLLTEHAVDWIKGRDKEKPFFMYLSHKGVHSEFEPAQRHDDNYKNEAPSYPITMFPDNVTKDTYDFENVPEWVKKQRYSWHGVDYMYHGQMDFDTFYRKYTETLLSVDESIGEVISALEREGVLENTLVFYMGDNGFSFGEHGLIDKRQAYEESIRVPMLAFGGGKLLAEDSVEQLIQNIDIGPTVLAMAGLQKPPNMDGESFLQILKGETPAGWRERIYYEYFWERPFPQTPTVHAVRTDKYKFIRYYGLWDLNELYDLENDPYETQNLIRSPQHQEIAKKLRNDIFDWLEETGGMQIPLKRDRGVRFDHGYKGTY
ncbi:MAG: sulfatase [Bacteroidota bacterium]